MCYGCTTLGKFQQYLNAEYKLSYVSWSSYILLFIYLIIYVSYFKNKALRYSFVFICLMMIYLPTIILLNILTLFLSLFFKNPPFIHDYHSIFPASIPIEQNSHTIINEFLRYTKEHTPSCIRESTPGFKIENNSTENNCWRALYLKKIGKIDPTMASYFPTTIDLVKDDQIHNAFFSILDPGVEIPPHVGYYKGYLRYHMGVIIPNNESGRTDDKAYIVCGGEKYIWKEHVGIVFDDLYLHHVKNPTNERRVVLYLDVKRKSDSYIVNQINHLGIYLIENSFLLNTFLKNQHRQQKLKPFV